MKQLSLVILCLVLFVLSSSAQRETPRSKTAVTKSGYRQVIPGKRKSALWRAKTDEESFTYYLRFYADRTVIGVTSSGTPREIKKWFKAPYDDSGKYSIDG